jgi:hypothetical protein
MRRQKRLKWQLALFQSHKMAGNHDFKAVRWHTIRKWESGFGRSPGEITCQLFRFLNQKLVAEFWWIWIGIMRFGKIGWSCRLVDFKNGWGGSYAPLRVMEKTGSSELSGSTSRRSSLQMRKDSRNCRTQISLRLCYDDRTPWKATPIGLRSMTPRSRFRWIRIELIIYSGRPNRLKNQLGI